MTTTPTFGRSTALAIVVAGHVAAVSVFALGGPVEIAARPAAITVHNVPAPAVEDIAPVIALADVPADVAAPVIDVAEAVTPGSGDCAMIDQLNAALASDRAVGRALDALTVKRRSTANAIMAWDGHWAEAPAPVRDAVVARVRSSPAACRAASVTGPRLLIVPAGGRPVVLAFGSGRWRWDDVLADRNPGGDTVERNDTASVDPASRNFIAS